MRRDSTALRIALLIVGLLTVTGCNEMVESETVEDEHVMAGRPPDRPAQIEPPPRAELIGKWKIGSPPYWPDVDFVLELRADGTGSAVQMNPSRNPLQGAIKWELISSRYWDDDTLKLTGGRNGNLDMEKYIHRVNRDTICIGYCASVMQRIK